MPQFEYDLLELLKITPTQETNQFIGNMPDNPKRFWEQDGRVFGGNTLGQSLAAAFTTVATDKYAHSIFANFHKMGAVNEPILYQVTSLHDGRTYSSRQIAASQNAELILSMQASFKSETESELYQPEMPSSRTPEESLAQAELRNLPARRIAGNMFGQIEQVPSGTALLPPEALLDGEEREYQLKMWRRLLDSRKLSHREQQLVLTYMSDGPIVGLSANRHSESPRLTHQAASLNHAIWFHRPVDTTHWMLFEGESVASGDGRALNELRVFSEDGVLAANIRQETTFRRINVGTGKW